MTEIQKKKMHLLEKGAEKLWIICWSLVEKKALKSKIITAMRVSSVMVKGKKVLVFWHTWILFLLEKDGQKSIWRRNC